MAPRFILAEGVLRTTNRHGDQRDPIDPMKRPTWQVLSGYLTAAGFLLLAVGWFVSGALFGDAEPQVRKPAAQLDGGNEFPAVRVRQQTADWHRRTIGAQGRTEADKRVTVRAEASGRLLSVPVEKGDRLADGARIARIDPQDKPASLKEAKARLAQRKAELRAAEKLSEKGFRAQQQLAKARAEYEQADARVRQAEVALSQTRVTAPFAGIVVRRPVDVGDYVTSGDAIADIIDLDPIRVVASISERNVDAVTLGQPITATTVGGRELKGSVTYIASDADERTRTFTVEAEVANPDSRVRAGVTVDIEIPVTATRAHFIAPSILTLAEDGTVGVKTVNGDNRVEFKPVTIEADTPEGVWVTGLPNKVTLITVGQNFVEAGQTVRPRSEAEIAKSLPGTDLSLPDRMPADPGPEAQP
jgi:multidrug efflux system membrane fusion protein